MIGQTKSKLFEYVGVFIIGSLLFLPGIKIKQQMPELQVIDFILPFLVLLLFIERKNIEWKNFYYFPIMISVSIVISILINIKFNALNDFFELYKVIKFSIILLFFSFIPYRFFLKKWVLIFFIISVLINIVHYFDLFSINSILEKYYNGGLHIKYFGYDTLGNRIAKRTIGTMGNPNTNGILFCFFTIYFFPFNKNFAKYILFLISLSFVFMTQSRTAMLFLGFSMIFFLFLYRKKLVLNHILTLSGLILLSYLSVWVILTEGFNYALISNYVVDGSILETGSARGRFETWNYLFNMYLNKPIFGYGPYKNYFYENRIYSENEYILYLWRYGLIGLLIYVSMYLFLFKTFFKSLFQDKNAKYGIFLVLLFGICALTNNPFTERTLTLIFAISLAFVFQKQTK
jgi:O-antigen ligase